MNNKIVQFPTNKHVVTNRNDWRDRYEARMAQIELERAELELEEARAALEREQHGKRSTGLRDYAIGGAIGVMLGLFGG